MNPPGVIDTAGKITAIIQTTLHTVTIFRVMHVVDRTDMTIPSFDLARTGIDRGVEAIARARVIAGLAITIFAIVPRRIVRRFGSAAIGRGIVISTVFGSRVIGHAWTGIVGRGRIAICAIIGRRILGRAGIAASLLSEYGRGGHGNRRQYSQRSRGTQMEGVHR